MYWRIIKTCNSYELQVLYKSSGVVLPSAYFRWCWHKLLRPCKITEAFVWLLKLSKKQLDVIRQWVQHYSKSVRENTTRNFSAKDKPGTLPLNLFESAPPEQHSVDFDVLLNEDIPVQHQDTSTACNIVIAQSRYVVVSRIYKPCSAPNSPLYITKTIRGCDWWLWQCEVLSAPGLGERIHWHHLSQWSWWRTFCIEHWWTRWRGFDHHGCWPTAMEAEEDSEPGVSLLLRSDLFIFRYLVFWFKIIVAI